ncbi:GNAT family N-acetyltransferase [Sutcliffiella sp. NC1]|uniref:GNAT family N-acetyltransferase n=1 Tax=Sutcliffiella sp. NC1 TaxID=3004096 RepID=UPI0022DE11A4|nr:GNAT family N-acetyltransferase [Sutcliffiella sp. NC1]WBL16651.1 GNAT family N-acetyltransferase [Sutcliffiella sp. NC1]
MKIQIRSWKDWDGSWQEFIPLWNQNLAESFPITELLFERNLVANEWVNEEASFVALENSRVVGFLVSKRDTEQGGCWISAILVDKEFRGLGIGSGMLREFEQQMSGADVLVGMDPYHLFPGIPSERTETIRFFQSQGYQVEGSAYDLRTSISDYAEKYPLQEGYSVRRLREGEQSTLLSLIQANFSQRWYDDTLAFLRKDRRVDGTVGLFKEDALIGFAHVHTFNDGYIGPSIFWKELLKEKYGGLGPIGVAKEYQGKGLGTSYFEQIVLLLQKEGVEDMVVDWTILLNYYGKFGFQPWKQYTHASKKQ